ncbi:MAG TPA: TetR/AcrR family transcriptional regulator [Pseudogracilibacillus sp.]|nr:TetR/AcrR family transcriptional regulator [Pseudogracilibacillus sp.]
MIKEEITKHSIQLFEKKGFSQTSIQDIVDVLDVTKGTFYYYFSSKEQLLMDIHLQYIDNLLSRQQMIFDNTSLSNKARLEEIILMLIKDIKKKGSSGRVFFREIRHLNNMNISKVKEKRNKFRLRIEEVVQNGIKAGEFQTNLPADMIAFGILGVTNYSYNWFKPNGEVSPEELAAIFSKMILNGIVSE